ncbi:DegT/DnrJ/EryC1/StrS family aminotransferase [Polynucleobacter sp. AP-Sanab-80-C2]|uniref:DegT/DnrJ/EryC1/StrS family aminotransferase n=1 Tax=Polynucleobacter sp. AP-Sanab-80-C2 TaxID=3108274 RepID=UPI002B23CFAF|nr:DegT/DnrJ/EryC1/StrS family aminotransferase [Polynucleobacter sp. AP-Sanab-80-C2]MEA9598549.1 DegT/DnrJ/EryC1/StrS family aminotransferase [Polynucleobacter sp. AP-Sanab-80-C2]
MLHCSYPLAQYLSQKQDILKAVQRVLDSGNYIQSEEVHSFEKEFSVYTNAKYSIGVNSGTDALILAIRALGIRAGDEVITVSHTALATVSAILACGAVPVLVDVDPIYYTMDPTGLRMAITSKTRAIIPVHLYGQVADLENILSIAKEYGLYVIEDCAQATGADYKGRKVGTLGDVGCFSFYPTKNLGAIGDGGMLITNNEEVAIKVRALGRYGWDENRYTNQPGINSRLDELQAAILRIKLKTLDADNNNRRLLARFYNEILQDFDLTQPVQRENSRHVFHLYVISGLKKRDQLRDALINAGFNPGVHYSLPAHQHPGYQELVVLPKRGLPVTEVLKSTILSLPMYPEVDRNSLIGLSSVFNEVVK